MAADAETPRIRRTLRRRCGLSIFGRIMKTSNSGYVELVATAAEQASVAVRQPRFGQPLPVAVVVGAADPMPLMETVQTVAVQICHASTVHGADVSARHCVGASQARRNATDVIKPSSADVTDAR